MGGGHNGLVAACYLARAGREVIVLEALDRPGSGAAGTPDHNTTTRPSSAPTSRSVTTVRAEAHRSPVPRAQRSSVPWW
ncbi:MAG: NAD(P)-binding protein [Acidimicrobiales bacterium]